MGYSSERWSFWAGYLFAGALSVGSLLVQYFSTAPDALRNATTAASRTASVRYCGAVLSEKEGTFSCTYGEFDGSAVKGTELAKVGTRVTLVQTTHGLYLTTDLEANQAVYSERDIELIAADLLYDLTAFAQERERRHVRDNPAKTLETPLHPAEN